MIQYEESKDSDKKHFRQLFAGFSAGALSSGILHPIDSLKVRIQAHGRGERSINHSPLLSKVHNKLIYRIFAQFDGAAMSILKSQGFGSLYRGLLPGVLGTGISWGLYFEFYSMLKSFFQNRNSLKNQTQQFSESIKNEDRLKIQQKPRNLQELSTLELLTSGYLAGAFTILFTHPIFFIKTRLQLQQTNSNIISSLENTSNLQTAQKQYKGFLDGIQNVLKQNGLRGLYKGFIPSLVLCSHGAIQFLVYEKLKYHFGSNNTELVSSQILFRIFFSPFNFSTHICLSLRHSLIINYICISILLVGSTPFGICIDWKICSNVVYISISSGEDKTTRSKE